MSGLINAIAAAAAVSTLSFIGVFALSLDEEKLHRILFVLISFSAGSILGAAYFDLLPEAVELVQEPLAFPVVTLGFVLFFFLERFIYWYHGHGHEADIREMSSKRPIKEFVYLNLLGDGIHNFIDGMVIAVSFFVSIPLGIVSTIAVIFHELPQEIGDFGILIYGGLKRVKALFFNFLSALSAVAGVLIAYLFSISAEEFSGFLIAFAAGGFIYLAASELIPELQKEESISRSMIQFIIFIMGLTLIWSLGIIFPE
ncbi:MAG: ZIP family metal transporter [Nitrososphaeria archaeon]|nr:ZIP family metal transporter [Nitrososphaeria archaeon]NIN53304.1 ZIP family metal transporter [Nitrososphaeria archaeon]NIQ33757.1 ZIP family metal transporter [Nitrososphaeria archaeon]